ncbi:MAG TPA: EF-hand domain-containing protein [Planctomycetota bacterium]|nr:EF-hand domain-containing protein [Planctomycetota bacterium]
MRLLGGCILVLAGASMARAQSMYPPGMPRGGGLQSPFGSGGYGPGGQADTNPYGNTDPRAQPDAFFGGFRSATRSRGSSIAQAHRLSLARRMGGPGAPGAGAPARVLPAELLAGLSSGPVTLEQARELVSALIAADVESLKATGKTYVEHAVARRTYAPTSDPEIAALQEKVDALVPDPAGATPDLPPRTLDQAALKEYFDALDTSKDSGITFLEWRDRTALGLPLFRKLDVGADGLIQFDEFARALVLNAASSQRDVEPKLHEWATTPPPKDSKESSKEGEDAKPADDLLPPESLDDVLARARALIADATAQHAALEPDAGAAAPGEKGAKGAKGKAATGTTKPKAGGDLFDLLRAGPKSKPAQKTRPPLPMPVPQPTDH